MLTENQRVYIANVLRKNNLDPNQHKELLEKSREYKTPEQKYTPGMGLAGFRDWLIENGHTHLLLNEETA